MERRYPVGDADTEGTGLTGEELEGAYRLLCGALLQHTARLLAEIGEDGRSVLALPGRASTGQDNSYVREVARQRRVAEDWLDGGGSLPFEECCDEFGFNPEQARDSLSRFLSACQAGEGGAVRFVTPSRAKGLLAGS